MSAPLMIVAKEGRVILDAAGGAMLVALDDDAGVFRLLNLLETMAKQACLQAPPETGAAA